MQSISSNLTVSATSCGTNKIYSYIRGLQARVVFRVVADHVAAVGALPPEVPATVPESATDL